MAFIFYFFIFLLGLAAGSFLNVVICRLETGEGIVKKRSHCPHCGRVLRWYDLVPIFSFILLRARCRCCRQKISWQYPLVEIATGALFVLVVFRFWNLEFGIWNLFGNWKLEIGDFITVGYWLFVICCLITIFVYDLRRYIIPDKIIYPAIIVTLVYQTASAFNLISFYLDTNPSFPPLNLRGGKEGLYPYLLSALGAAAFFFAIVLLTRGRGMGIGDVKLAFLMGLLLGWPNILAALFLAFGSGALVGLILVFLGKKKLKSQIPFGPFLIAGTLVTLFAGSSLISWYSNLFLLY